MKRFHIIVATSVTIFFSHSFASTPEFLWNDQTGLQPAGFCETFTLTSYQPKSVNALDILEITDVPTALSLNDSLQPLVGSFWQSVSEDGNATMAKCNQTDYALFEVHFKNNPNQSMLIAAQANASIFNFVRTHTPEEAEAAFAPARTPSSTSLVDGVSAFEGTFQNVICGTTENANVYGADLGQVAFTAPKTAAVQVVQAWGVNEKNKTVNGKTVRFIKVQFPQNDLKNKTGWVQETDVRPLSECSGEVSLKAVAARATSWIFPTLKRTTQNYKQGMRRFKASRSGGRLHAACDLYRVKAEQISSVTGGTVIRDRYYFYEGTYALEIKHDGGKVVRYGEINGTSATGVSQGKTVKAGQTVGYMGKVNSNCCEPMLHFEMYSGTASGALTQSGNSFRRRSDLIDPSAYLTEWEKAKFGTNY
jgi:murein DD-endopeptidase MepM/ murein hydrolase activator NlpD